jgi:hypothetical protein
MSESETKSHFLIVMMFNFSSMVANFRFNCLRRFFPELPTSTLRASVMLPFAGSFRLTSFLCR